MATAEELLAKGKLAATSGQKDIAREALGRVVEMEPNNEEAWLWLSGVASSLTQMRGALDRVISINPNNQQAREGLAWVNTREAQLRAAQAAQTAAAAPAEVAAATAGAPAHASNVPLTDTFTAEEEGEDEEDDEAPVIAPKLEEGATPMYPNAGLRLLLLSIEKVTGEKGVNALLNASSLHKYVGSFPPNDMRFIIPYTEYSAVGKAMEDFYGRTTKALQLKVGSEIFLYGLNEQPRLLGVLSTAMKFMPLTMKMKLTLNKMVSTARGLNVPTHLEEDNASYTYVMEICPYCYDRTTSVGCNALSGTIAKALNWATGKTFHVEEVTCRGKGDSACSYRVDKTPAEGQ
jgi:V4R domain-containing protein